MMAVNYSEFRNNLKEYLDRVEHDQDILILKRKTGNGTVVMSMQEYNSLMETLHLKSSKANADWLSESIKQSNERHLASHPLLEE